MKSKAARWLCQVCDLFSAALDAPQQPSAAPRAKAPDIQQQKRGHHSRKPLSIALSHDETGSIGGPQDDAHGDEEYSYPSLLQDENGKITVAYTYRRESIKVVRFDEG